MVIECALTGVEKQTLVDELHVLDSGLNESEMTEVLNRVSLEDPATLSKGTRVEDPQRSSASWIAPLRVVFFNYGLVREPSSLQFRFLTCGNVGAL